MEYGPRRVTREEILDFAAEFDPQPFHLDEVAARPTMLGGLCASGWHSCCILMRMSADGFVLNSSSMGAPGIDEVLWLRMTDGCIVAGVGPGRLVWAKRVVVELN